MKIILETTLHCENCVIKITPYFNDHYLIKKWEVDLKKPNSPITVESDEKIDSTIIQQLLQKAGYDVIMPNASFWNDINKWKRASFNTLNCLLGCSIGDIGMLLYLQRFQTQIGMLWQMVSAIVAGLFTSILLETMLLKYRENFDWKNALQTAFGMSLLSMIMMEIAMNTTDFMITGGKAAFSNPIYWMAIVLALVVGFLVPLPYNYYRLKKFNQACH